MEKDLFAGGERQKLFAGKFRLELGRVAEKNYFALFIYVSLQFSAHILAPVNMMSDKRALGKYVPSRSVSSWHKK